MANPSHPEPPAAGDRAISWPGGPPDAQPVFGRLRRLHITQLLLLGLIGVAAIGIAVGLGRAITNAGDRQAAAERETLALSDLGRQFRALESEFWRGVAEGEESLSLSQAAEFTVLVGRLRAIRAGDDDVTDEERAATAEFERVFGKALAVASRVTGRSGERNGRSPSEVIRSEYDLVPELRAAYDGLLAAATAELAVARLETARETRRYTIVLAVVIGMLMAVGVGLSLRFHRLRTALIEDLRASERAFRSLVQKGSDLTMVVDAGGTVSYASPSAERVLGGIPEEYVGTRLAERVHPEDRDLLRLLVDVHSGDPQAEPVSLRMRHTDGAWRHVEAVATDLVGDPAVRGVVVNARDVTDRRVVEEQLAHQAFHDPLTGLANRALFEDRLQHAVRRHRRDGAPVVVILLDIDDFKTVNDSLGHQAGDDLIAQVAKRIAGAVREGDTAARLGGDEFAVLMEDGAGKEEAVSLARRILEAVTPPVTLGDYELSVRASLGIAMTGQDSVQADELLRAADMAMYAAKGSGRGGVAVFDPGMRARADERLALRADLMPALKRGQLFVEYQPIVELGTGSVTGVEALVRWRHPQRGVVGPGDFIPLAEESGLIDDIGGWVLTQACRAGRRWLDMAARPDGFIVSVNVSARQLEDPAFPATVQGVLRRSGLPAEHLVLELTETVLMGEQGATAAALTRLRDLGVRVAIDDFGTGYSSLSYLARLPVDIVKIDRSFVADVGAGGDSEVAALIVQLVGVMNLQAIAEGIESDAQMQVLRTLGCGLGQGYRFARPGSPDVIDAMLRAHAEGVGSTAG